MGHAEVNRSDAELGIGTIHLNAFAKASFAANRAAFDAIGRSASAAVKIRRTRPGRRSIDAANLSTSQTSMPTPTIIRFCRTLLGNRAWSPPSSSLAPERAAPCSSLLADERRVYSFARPGQQRASLAPFGDARFPTLAA